MIELQPQGTGLLAVYPKPRRTFRMKQPIKDELRRRLEVATAQAIVLQAQLDDALPMNTVRKLLVVAVVIGVALGRFAL